MAVSGTFYPKEKQQLSSDVKKYLKSTKRLQKTNNKALIVPHAGYFYSANIAAHSYINIHKQYKNIFLIGSSHYENFDGASVYTNGDYKTPLGNVVVNLELAKKLVNKHELFVFEEDAHEKEHALEVQLPFLQTIFRNDLSIVPIVFGTSNIKEIKEIADILKPYFEDEQNLFIISTDLSHFPSYELANKIDKKTISTIEKNSPQEFINLLISNNKDKKVETLACGWSSVLMLLYLTQDKEYNYEFLEYANSGDVVGAKKNKVVGYTAMKIYEKEVFTLSEDEKSVLKSIAKQTLDEAVIKGVKHEVDASGFTQTLKADVGAFVTLYKNKQLRGCVGTFEPKQALYEVVRDMAISSAFHDTRFKPLTKDELEDIEIEVSVLTPRQKINSLDEIVIGKHGIYIQKGSHSGTYLPHVATQMGWNVEEFVKSCAFEKAGLSKDEYKDADIYIYESIVF
jgi:AmmeMemoRadiSam system protein B/AmmeMemoRadiSam system protein A